MSVGAVVIRCFGEDEDAPRVSRALELACTPGRGQKLAFPDTPDPVFVDRVIQRPLEPGSWHPGSRCPAVDVEMAPEPSDGLQAALSAGWALHKV
jgi:hypothetical protein